VPIVASAHALCKIYLHLAFDFVKAFKYNQYRTTSNAGYVNYEENTMEYLTITEAAGKRGISTKRVSIKIINDLTQLK